MNVPGFTPEAINLVNEMFAQGQENPLAGKCGQKKLREQNKTQRTAAQEQADQARSRARRGKDTMNSATRSEAAKKAAETRARCKGGSPTASTTTA
jgi:hypothetical protein